MTDPHDPRDFKQFAKIGDDGKVLATSLVASNVDPPDDGAVYLDVTAHYPVALDALTVAPALVTALKRGQVAQRRAQQAMLDAKAQIDAAQVALAAEMTKAVETVKAAAAQPVAPK